MLASLATYFPPDEPQPSPPLAKAAVLREGALLSECRRALQEERRLTPASGALLLPAMIVS